MKLAIRNLIGIVVFVGIAAFASVSAGAALIPHLEWTQTYDSPAHSRDCGLAVALDAAGNVYVTGYESRYDVGQGQNMWLRKYDTNGGTLWTQTYDSPAHSQDIASGVALDAAGNVYVAGYEYRTDLGQDYNIWLRKYDTNGDTLWTQTYDSPAHSGDFGGDAAVDVAGNVYVMGHEYRPDLGQDHNIWLRKYDTDGNTLWTQTYDSPDHGCDQGGKVALDAAGNIYVTGWETRDDLGQGRNIWLRKYDTNGNTLWTETYDSPAHSNDIGAGVGVDGAGNVYLTGYEHRPDLGQGDNIWLRKYDSNGNTLWTQTYDSPAHLDDYDQHATVDVAGNVYLAGYENRSDLGEDNNIWLRKYDTNGNVLWTETYDNPAHSEDLGHGVALDGAGNVYVIGHENRPDLGQDCNIVLLKYSQTEGIIPEPSALLLLAPGLLGIAAVLRGKFRNRR